ncbi:flavin reductase family protein [Pusillimonas sp.]|uniref:flavin reductase family protein n=1 Tax=Pusillimonas sp. TaxID=3040095 RepID=UPI0037C5FDF3
MIMNNALNQAFRQAMRQMAGGVCVITVNDGEERTGLTATSVVSVSMDPPELLISVNRSSSSWPVLEKAGRFGINVLNRAQQQVAENFSGKGGLRGAARYADDDWLQTPQGVWLSRKALTVFACDVEKVFQHRQHALVIGKVAFIDVMPGPLPLTYWEGSYRTLSQASVA